MLTGNTSVLFFTLNLLVNIADQVQSFIRQTVCLWVRICRFLLADVIGGWRHNVRFGWWVGQCCERSGCVFLPFLFSCGLIKAAGRVCSGPRGLLCFVDDFCCLIYLLHGTETVSCVRASRVWELKSALGVNKVVSCLSSLEWTKRELCLIRPL